MGIGVLSSFRVNFGTVALPTSSVAVKAEELSLVFVATDDLMIRGVSDFGEHFVLNYSVALLQFDISGGAFATQSSSFYNQPVSSAVHQMVWQDGQNYITAVTSDSVSHHDSKTLLS